MEGLDKKEFDIFIRWIVDAETIIDTGVYEYLEKLREIGEAQILDINLIDKGER